MQDTRKAALAWAARGFAVFPLSPATNRPVVEDWPNVATKDPERIAELWGDNAYNIGCHCDGMIVVDVDVKKGKPGIASMVDLDLPLDTLTVKTPSGGLHLYYRGPNVPNRVGTLAPGLDVRSKGGYVVAPGSSRNGVPYELVNDVAVLDAPEDLISRAGAVREKSTAPAVEVDQGAAMSRAIQWLQNEAPIAVEFDGGDGTTYQVACQLRDWGVTELNALLAMSTYWNGRCAPPWEPAELQTKVENAFRYATGTAGAQTVEAEYADVKIPPIEKAAAPEWDWIDEGDEWRVNVNWLVYGVLPQAGVGVLTAPSGAGKTFLAFHLAKCLALAEPFFDAEVDEKGGTVLLNAESPGSPRRRLAALESPERLPISALNIDSLGKKGALAALVAPLMAKSAEFQAKFGVPLRLVVLDTLSASGLLDDESDNAKAAAVVKALGKVAAKLGVFLLILHHPTKEGRGERGAGAIRGSADVMLTATREEYSPVRDLAVTKARDGEERELGSYTLPTVILGEDDKGRPIVSCTVTTGPTSSRSTRPPAHLDCFIEAANSLLDGPSAVMSEGKRFIEEGIVETQFYETKDGSRDRGLMRQQYHKARQYALNMGLFDTRTFDRREHFCRLEIEAVT